ncbi:protein CpxP [Vibrio hangzhouensis]|uniref:Protein CpxP n=2 Tax=Vibrio hangzhouensis TaxID=462991 RepID=A0A1H6AP07_9VIBR|nr:protein CpxP [Vibrio hangzhouensis]
MNHIKVKIMKFSKKLVIAATVLPLALGSASALAYGGGKGGHHGKGGEGMCGGFDGKRIFRDLDLTDAQKEQMKQLRQQSRDDMRGQFAGDFATKKAEMQARHQKMQSLVLADSFNADAANALAAEMVQQQTERRVKILEKQHEMLNILTPEQKEKFKQLQQERMENCLAKIESRAEKRSAQ